MRRVGEARRGSGAEEEGGRRQAVGQERKRRVSGGKLWVRSRKGGLGEAKCSWSHVDQE